MCMKRFRDRNNPKIHQIYHPFLLCTSDEKRPQYVCKAKLRSTNPQRARPRRLRGAVIRMRPFTMFTSSTTTVESLTRA